MTVFIVKPAVCPLCKRVGFTCACGQLLQWARTGAPATPPAHDAGSNRTAQAAGETTDEARGSAIGLGSDLNLAKRERHGASR